jgi:hypothetical protein
MANDDSAARPSVAWTKKRHELAGKGTGLVEWTDFDDLLDAHERLQKLADAVLRGGHRELLLPAIQEWEGGKK